MTDDPREGGRESPLGQSIAKAWADLPRLHREQIIVEAVVADAGDAPGGLFGLRQFVRMFLAAHDALERYDPDNPLGRRMTDRPRVYRATRVRHPNGGETSFAEPVTLIEWSRERTIPAMTAAIQAYDADSAIQAYDADSDGEWTAEGTARAIYGTLDHD